MVTVTLCGSEPDIVDSVAFLELAVQQKKPDHSMKVIVVASEAAAAHANFVSDLLATMPFTTKLAHFAPLGGLIYYWITGDISWPRGTKSNGYLNDCMYVKPPQKQYMEKYPESIQDHILTGWKFKATQHFVTDLLEMGVCESQGKEARGLYAGEYEKLLGLDLNTSNIISKEQDEKLHARELRRKALLSRCFPKAAWTFVLNSAVLAEEKRLLALKPP